MATTTQRIVVQEQNGKAWNTLTAGPRNVLLKVAKGQPGIEVIVQATGTPDPTADQYFFLEWDDVALSVALLTGESLYYRIESGRRCTIFAMLQG